MTTSPQVSSGTQSPGEWGLESPAERESQAQDSFRSMPIHVCTECGVEFVVYGAISDIEICESQECLLSWCRRESIPLVLMCSCSQRPYPHEISVHDRLRYESYDLELRYRWPWSLVISDRLEPSSER